MNVEFSIKGRKIGIDYPPLVIAEIGRLVSNNPIVFIENDGILNLYSLQSLLPENNLMIDNEGLWLGKYIPARYRSLPFVLASNSNNEDKKEKILCFVEDFPVFIETD